MESSAPLDTHIWNDDELLFSSPFTYFPRNTSMPMPQQHVQVSEDSCDQTKVSSENTWLQFPFPMQGMPQGDMAQHANFQNVSGASTQRGPYQFRSCDPITAYNIAMENSKLQRFCPPHMVTYSEALFYCLCYPFMLMELLLRILLFYCTLQFYFVIWLQP
jgi:hypothetical protein